MLLISLAFSGPYLFAHLVLLLFIHHAKARGDSVSTATKWNDRPQFVGAGPAPAPAPPPTSRHFGQADFVLPLAVWFFSPAVTPQLARSQIRCHLHILCSFIYNLIY